jgi:hypothetical protein
MAATDSGGEVNTVRHSSGVIQCGIATVPTSSYTTLVGQSTMRELAVPWTVWKGPSDRRESPDERRPMVWGIDRRE